MFKLFAERNPHSDLNSHCPAVWDREWFPLLRHLNLSSCPSQRLCPAPSIVQQRPAGQRGDPTRPWSLPDRKRGAGEEGRDKMKNDPVIRQPFATPVLPVSALCTPPAETGEKRLHPLHMIGPMQSGYYWLGFAFTVRQSHPTGPGRKELAEPKGEEQEAAEPRIVAGKRQHTLPGNTLTLSAHLRRSKSPPRIFQTFSSSRQKTNYRLG